MALSLGLSVSAWGQGSFCGAVGTPGCNAVHCDSSAIIGWATECTVVRGPVDIINPDGPLARYGQEEYGIGPAGTITTKDHHALVTYYGNGQPVSIDNPCPTLTTKDRMAKVTFIQNEYSGGGQLSDINSPNPAVMTTPKQKLVSCFLMNPQYESAGGSVNKPCFTLIARMDKMPPYLISAEEGVGIQILDSDSPMIVKIAKRLKKITLALGFFLPKITSAARNISAKMQNWFKKKLQRNMATRQVLRSFARAFPLQNRSRGRSQASFSRPRKR